MGPLREAIAVGSEIGLSQVRPQKCHKSLLTVFLKPLLVFIGVYMTYDPYSDRTAQEQFLESRSSALQYPPSPYFFMKFS